MSSVTENCTEIQSLLKKTLPGEVRILVNGANGWLGRNISESLWQVFGDSFDSKVLLTGSKDSIMQLQDTSELEIRQWSHSLVTQFSPTHVIQLAFKTRDHVGEMSVDEYLEINQEIINNSQWMISLPSLIGFLHTSSGAALGLNANDKYLDPYGYLKKFEEEVYPEACAKNGKDYLGLRVWSTTGRYIKTGNVFAIESFINQAIRSKSIAINSPGKVVRSYADANEIILAGLIGLFSGHHGVYNSGGIDVELGDLAKLICEQTGVHESDVLRLKNVSIEKDAYVSKTPKVAEIINAFGLDLSDLRSQVENTVSYLIDLQKADG